MLSQLSCVLLNVWERVMFNDDPPSEDNRPSMGHCYVALSYCIDNEEGRVIWL
jgi:hypothetical protein